MCRETLLYLVARPTPDPPWVLALLDSARRVLGGGRSLPLRTEINRLNHDYHIEVMEALERVDVHPILAIS